MSREMRLTVYATLELWRFLNDTCVGVTIRSAVSMLRTAFIGSAAPGTQGIFCRRQLVDVRRAGEKAAHARFPKPALAPCVRSLRRPQPWRVSGLWAAPPASSPARWGGVTSRLRAKRVDSGYTKGLISGALASCLGGGSASIIWQTCRSHRQSRSGEQSRR